MRSGWKRAAKSRLSTGSAITVMLTAGVAAPSMAQERLEQDFGVIRACHGRRGKPDPKKSWPEALATGCTSFNAID
jgi:hypothetical protein